MIQRLNSYNLLTDKVTENVTQTIYRPEKENKKSIGESEMNFPYGQNIKALKYKSCHSFRTCQKKIVEFTDSTHTIC